MTSKPGTSMPAPHLRAAPLEEGAAGGIQAARGALVRRRGGGGGAEREAADSDAGGQDCWCCVPGGISLIRGQLYRSRLRLHKVQSHKQQQEPLPLPERWPHESRHVEATTRESCARQLPKLRVRLA